MDALIIFGATFLAVFALGLQSLNVNQGHYIAAAATSTLISTGHIYLYELMPQATLATRLGYYLGGIVGITASMWFHREVKAWWSTRKEKARRKDCPTMCGCYPYCACGRPRLKKGGINDAPTTPKPPAPPGQVARRSKADEHADVARCGLLRDDTH